jgi:hypothetical protein
LPFGSEMIPDILRVRGPIGSRLGLRPTIALTIWVNMADTLRPFSFAKRLACAATSSSTLSVSLAIAATPDTYPSP